MLPVEVIEKEHGVIRRRLDDIEKAFSESDRENILMLLLDFESYWNSHEEKEEKFLDWFEENSGEEFPFGKTLVNEHRRLRGHWKVLKDFLLNKRGPQLAAALNTDGKMVLDKIREHIRKEDAFFARTKLNQIIR